MIIHDAPQGSPEWLRLRAGVISGSNFSLARERAKTGKNAGDISNAAKKHAFKLALERIAGQPQGEEFSVWQAKRGQELEPYARMQHEARLGVVVEQAGFITTDDGRFGVSVDGLIDDDKGAEYKCFLDPDKLMAFYLDGDFSAVMDQIQGGMWITGRTEWHLGLYYPGLEAVGGDLLLVRIQRDENYIEAMVDDLVEFMRLVDSYEARVRARISQGMLVGFDEQVVQPTITPGGDQPSADVAPVAPKKKSWRDST